MCGRKRLVCGTHFQLTPVLFFFPPFFFLKNHLHNNSCECTNAATDHGPEMIQWWCYEAMLTVIQLDFAELQLRKWALKPEHVNICQPIDLLPIIPLYMLILFANGAYSCLVSLRNWAFTAKLYLYEWYAMMLFWRRTRLIFTPLQEHIKHVHLCRIIDRMTSDQTSKYFHMVLSCHLTFSLQGFFLEMPCRFLIFFAWICVFLASP